MYLDIGFLSYVFALIPTLVFAVISLKRQKSAVYLLSGSFLFWIIAFTAINNIFPVTIGPELSLSSMSDNGLWLKFVMPPFWSFPTGFEFIRATFAVYWTIMPFGLLLGLLSAFTFRPLRKPWFALIFIISALLITDGSCFAVNLILGMKSRSIDSTTSIITLFTFLVGYGAAMLVMKLTPGVANAFDRVRTKPAKDTKENKKVRRKTVEI